MKSWQNIFELAIRPDGYLILIPITIFLQGVQNLLSIRVNQICPSFPQRVHNVVHEPNLELHGKKLHIKYACSKPILWNSAIFQSLQFLGSMSFYVSHYVLEVKIKKGLREAQANVSFHRIKQLTHLLNTASNIFSLGSLPIQTLEQLVLELLF